MKNLFVLFLFLPLLFSCSSFTGLNNDPDLSLTLRYDKPAKEWTDALPVGNGRLAAMVYGGTAVDTIQFNEETLWSGQPHDYAHKGAYNGLAKIRQLLWEGKQREAETFAMDTFMSQPLGQQCYQSLGKVKLRFQGHENVTKYERRLNLKNAVSSVYYEVDGVKFKREVFASATNQVIVIRIESSQKGALNFVAGMDSPHAEHQVLVEGNQVIIRGKSNNYQTGKSKPGIPYPESRLTFEARLKVVNEGGSAVQKGNNLEIANADRVTLYLVAATSFVNYTDISANPAERCVSSLKNIPSKPYHVIKSLHENDYSMFFDRVSLDLGKSILSERPTDMRLSTFNKDEDPNLVALLYQYGRYLLISSSRPGTQPANLQGIWNDRLVPPWDSKYTININTEMNYWPAEITNLSEMTEPLIKMVEDISVSGRNVAKEHYNMKGWVTHHNTDIWRGAAPINHSNHGIWPTGGAWLSQHLWWHYQFTGDKEYLKNKAYPILKEASVFFSEYLTPDPKHPEWLVSGPSNSPELGGLVMGPNMDHQIIRELLANTIEAAEILGVDAEFANKLKEIRAKIAPNQIGQYGQLQEWVEDKDNPKDQHRHVSHLWGLHPGSEIHPLTTPALAEACKVTLSQRGDGGTGWSRAWKINFWARLLDGDHAFLLLKNLMVQSKSQETDYKDRGGLYNNLFDSHPPFQIDGNFGATSGITEMLLQSHLRDKEGDFFQDILPALPKALATGSVKGIKGRGGFEFEISWKDGNLDSLTIISQIGNQLNLRYKGKTVSKDTFKGQILTFNSDDFL